MNPSSPSSARAWQLLTQAHGWIAGQIQSAREVSTREVLAAGKNVTAIVNVAVEFVHSLDETLRLSQAQGESNALPEIREGVMRQETLIDEALDSARIAKTLVDKIDSAARASRLLALNARIEASRISADGASAFDVIATEVCTLSDQIEEANEEISDLLQKLNQMLPQVSEQAHATRSLVEDLHQQQQQQSAVLLQELEATRQSSHEVMDKVVVTASTALMHLQFQDPMIQNIERIDGVLTDALNDAAHALGVDERVDGNYTEPLSAQILEEEEAAADVEAADVGEVLLF